MPSREAVDAFYVKAMSFGVFDEGKPGERGPSFYMSYFPALDDNKFALAASGKRLIVRLACRVEAVHSLRSVSVHPVGLIEELGELRQCRTEDGGLRPCVRSAAITRLLDMPKGQNKTNAWNMTIRQTSWSINVAGGGRSVVQLALDLPSILRLEPAD